MVLLFFLLFQISKVFGYKSNNTAFFFFFKNVNSSYSKICPQELEGQQRCTGGQLLPFPPQSSLSCSVMSAMVLQRVRVSSDDKHLLFYLHQIASPLVSCPCVLPCLLGIAVKILPVSCQFPLLYCSGRPHPAS